MLQAVYAVGARDILNASSAQQASLLQSKLFHQELDKLIERELIYQDALQKLEKNKKTLDKLKAAADKEFEKHLSQMVKNTRSASLDEFKQLLAKQGTSVENMRRSAEREFIATEYVRSLIGMQIVKLSHQDVCDYYEQHLNEFQTVDTVRWQNIFIAVGPNHPTTADARRFAEELVARARQGEDFDKLLPFDDGDSWRELASHLPPIMSVRAAPTVG